MTLTGTLTSGTKLSWQEKLNEAIMVMNRSLNDVNVQNMNVELVAQMFKNYQSNVLFHLEGESILAGPQIKILIKA